MKGFLGDRVHSLLTIRYHFKMSCCSFSISVLPFYAACFRCASHYHDNVLKRCELSEGESMSELA